MNAVQYDPTEWEPGDIAILKFKANGVRKQAICQDRGWQTKDGFVPFGVVDTAHRLVVIDPETVLPTWPGNTIGCMLAGSAEVVAKDVAPRHVYEIDLLNTLADLFDEATGVPKVEKPEEPLGLGAVIEAGYENHYVRVNDTDRPWQRVSDRDEGTCAWDEIAVVQVLSEGVSA